MEQKTLKQTTQGFFTYGSHVTNACNLYEIDKAEILDKSHEIYSKKYVVSFTYKLNQNTPSASQVHD